MSQEEIDGMSVADYEEYEKKRILANAWDVAKEVTRRIDGAPVLGEYIKAHLSDELKDMFFFDNRDLIHEYAKISSASRKQSVPGSTYIGKILSFIESHFKIGELYMEYLKTGCLEHGDLCGYCDTHPFTGPVMTRIPQPIPDPDRPLHYLDVFQTSTLDASGKPRQA